MLAPRIVTCSPSESSSKSVRPGRRDQRHSAANQPSGPGFGKRPVADSATFVTTRTPDSTALLRGDAVEVGVVDDRDVVRLQALHEVLRAAPEPRRPRVLDQGAFLLRSNALGVTAAGMECTYRFSPLVRVARNEAPPAIRSQLRRAIVSLQLLDPCAFAGSPSTSTRCCSATLAICGR